ncbi:MAG: glycosyltransferase family 39 protein [Desulfobacterales bacterium]|nr:glycosyltransferase family 39 protein [Desulfobacterales bacterium]
MFEKISEFSDNKKGLYFVLIVSLMIKVLTLIIMNEMAINRDGTQYIAAAQQFAQGNFKEGFAFHGMPLYPLIIMAVNFLIRDWLLSARLISIACLVLAIIPLYLITRELFDRRSAFWGCILFSVSPEISQLGMEVLRDPAFIFCLLWTVYFSIKAIQTGKMLFFLFAAFFSWTPFLFRVEGVIFAPFYFIFLVCLVSISLFTSQEKMPYLKGAAIWIGYCILIATFIWLVIGSEIISFNKLENIRGEIEKLAGFRIGESYNRIYEQLKTLEDMSLYPSGNQNFAEVARHFMPFIYLVGLLEILIKNIFIFFLIPLIWGFRSSFKRSHIFLITFVGFYILIIFYTYIERDFIQSRFLQAPAILLYPWIGLGFQKIFSSIQASKFSKSLLAVCIFFFILMPMGKFVKGMDSEDGVIYRTGEWIKTKPEFQNVKSYTNDSRVGFHAGWTRKSYEKATQKYNMENRKRGITLEQFAVKNKIDLVVLRVSKKKLESAPKFITYRLLREFKGKKNIVFIYCSPASCSKFGGEENT